MIHIYHPNKAVKGFACSFWYSAKYKSFFATLIKQHGWNAETQNGTFKGSLSDPTKHINIKLSEVEVCGILDCIERNRPFSAYHSSDEVPKSISFAPWTSEDKAAGSPAVQKGFSFSVTVGSKTDTTKNSFYIGLTFAEARYVREYLIYSLHNQFGALYTQATTQSEQPNAEEANNPSPEASDVSNDPF